MNRPPLSSLRREVGGSFVCLWLNDLVPDRVVNDFADGMDLELAHNIASMSCNSVSADLQPVRDFFVTFGFGQKLYYLSLPCAQWRFRLVRTFPRSRTLQVDTEHK